MKISKEQLKELIRESIREQLERSSMEREYPELWDVASDIRMSTVRAINEAARTIESDVPYKKSQAILEILIEQLQELV